MDAGSRRRRRRRAALGLVAALLVTCGVAAGTVDRWFMDAIDPGPFDPQALPPAPDYRSAAAWAALPEVDDGADVALPELPAIDPAAAPADVFYLHPTTHVGKVWNAPIDEPAVVEATLRGGTLIQASAFNGCCAVYAPRYRQAHGRAFTEPDGRGDRAIDGAYGDVAAAFDEFLARTGERPFILAGHSQGAVLGARLLRERIAGGPLRRRLVAAYLPGAPLRPGADVGGLPICDGPTATGCVISWHARGPGYTPNGLEFGGADPGAMRGRICVNPITWRTDGAYAPASAQLGAVFFDAPTPALRPSFADARCVDGALIVREHGDLERDLPSRALLWILGPENYHPLEYQLFYADIRRNAATRVAALVAGAG
jgi:pimeloyl-ACP methyl ester carboxylesterase